MKVIHNASKLSIACFHKPCFHLVLCFHKPCYKYIAFYLLHSAVPTVINISQQIHKFLLQTCYAGLRGISALFYCSVFLKRLAVVNFTALVYFEISQHCTSSCFLFLLFALLECVSQHCSTAVYYKPVTVLHTGQCYTV